MTAKSRDLGVINRLFSHEKPPKLVISGFIKSQTEWTGQLGLMLKPKEAWWTGAAMLSVAS